MTENDPAWERYNNALEALNQASARFRDLRHLPDHHRDRVEALDAVIRAHVALDKAGDEIGWAERANFAMIPSRDPQVT
jgi:hypothetical protein